MKDKQILVIKQHFGLQFMDLKLLQELLKGLQDLKDFKEQQDHLIQEQKSLIWVVIQLGMLVMYISVMVQQLDQEILLIFPPIKL
jgi:hypothetical protein